MLFEYQNSIYSIHISLIKQLGINKSILLQEIHYVANLSKTGWVCKSYHMWSSHLELFGWGKDEIRNMMEDLFNNDVLLFREEEGKRSLSVQVNQQHPMFKGTKFASVKTKPGTLPKTDPDLVPYLRDDDPGKYIKDTTTIEDTVTLSNTYDGDSWQYRYATNFWILGHRFGFLTVPQWLKREFVLQQWADEFDKVVRTSKGTKEQIITIMRWLVEVDKDNWWLNNGFQSPNKFHKQSKEDGSRFVFDQLLKKALKDVPPFPINGHKYYKPVMNKLIEWYQTVKREDFKVGSGDQYVYMPE